MSAPLTATWLDDDGCGVADDGGVAVHVVDLLPGERATVALTARSQHHPRAFGRIDRRTGPCSAARQAPACPAFGDCGGCAWQHLAYPAQLAEKRARIARALAPLGIAEVAAVVPSPRETGYRNKVIWSVGGALGALRLGGFAPRSHRLVDTIGCRTVVPALAAIAGQLGAALAGLTPVDAATGIGELRHVVGRASRGGEVLLALVTPVEVAADRLAGAAAALGALPGVVGVVQVASAGRSGAVLDGPVVPLVGRATLAETIAGIAVDLAIDAFVQVNLAQAEALYAALVARTGAGPATRAIDLYGGVGAIAFALARAGAAVHGVERHPAAVATARAAAARAGLADRLRFDVADAGDRDALAAAGPADLVVVNPPRKGLAAATRAALIARAPAELAYVSCDPTSLARDLAELLPHYRVDWLQPYDLMPGTHPVETAVVLRLRAGR